MNFAGRKRKIILDFILNIFAYGLSVFTMHFVVNPYLAKVLGAEVNGIMLTLISAINLVSNTLGLTLNNTRLICDDKYNDDNVIDNDFCLLLSVTGIINVIVTGVFFIVYIKTLTGIIFYIFLASLWMTREYFVVAFRLKLNFKAILINNTILAGGYILGVFSYRYTQNWMLVLIFGQAASLVYVLLNARNRIKMPGASREIRIAIKDYSNLLIANFFSSASNNLDKLLIYPLLGGAQVTIYYAATIFTKIISIVVTPVNGVVLSYLSQKDRKGIKFFSFKTVLISSFIISFIGYFICLVVGNIALQILYPQYKADASQYLILTSASSMLLLIVSMIRPYLLKECKTMWQIIINVVPTLILIFVAPLLIVRLEIWGMCIAYTIMSVIKLVIMIAVYYRTRKATETNF